MMTPGQRRSIFMLCRELGWSDDFRHEMLVEWIGKPSLAADAERPVTHAEAAEILRRLAASIRSEKARRSAAHRRRRRHWPDDRITPEQQHAIEQLAGDVFGDLAKFRAWLRRQWHVEAVDWLSPKQGTACIVALKKMLENGWRPNTPRRSSSTSDEVAE